MLADFYIPKLSNDMKNTIHNNDLMGLILDIILDRSKKRRLCITSTKILQNPVVKRGGQNLSSMSPFFASRY